MIRFARRPGVRPRMGCGCWLTAAILAILLIPVVVYAYNTAQGIGTYMTARNGWEVRSYWLAPLDETAAARLDWTDKSQVSPDGRWRASIQGHQIIVTGSDADRSLSDFSPLVSAPIIDRLAWLDDDTIAIHQESISSGGAHPVYAEPSYVVWKWRHGQILPDAGDDFWLKFIIIFVILTPLLARLLLAVNTGAKKLGARLWPDREMPVDGPGIEASS